MLDTKITTKEIEHIAYSHLSKIGTYLCFEVGIPKKYRGTGSDERVDLLQYDTKNIWRFYEIKITKSDFYSKCKNSFLGHYNYYIIPHYLYEDVKKDIPSHIGVFLVFRDKKNNCYMSIEKKPKLQEMNINKDDLMFNFMQALSREYAKYRKILKKSEEDK